MHVPYNDEATLRAAIDENTCAVMLELIQGESGVRPADYAYVQLAAELCKKTGARLIIDEIQTGMGRTGHFFAYQGYEIQPDIVTLAKGLAGGVPIGAFIANEDTATGFAPGDHGSTFGGNPLACAAALAVLDVFKKDNLILNAEKCGLIFHDLLQQIADATGMISEIRGKGLMIGIEFTEAIAVQVKTRCFEKGYLVGTVGDQVVRLLPPLIITENQIRQFTGDLAAILKEINQGG